jgi:uncharacterized protein YodC (DUF2158 family)
MADAFNIGDLVQLKSGGPVMTVEGTILDRTNVAWFAYGKRHSALFEPQALKAATLRKRAGRPNRLDMST